MPLVESPLSIYQTEAFYRRLQSKPRVGLPVLGCVVALLVVALAYLSLQSAVMDDQSSYPGNIDLPQFHQVDPYLYRGGAPTDTGLRQLKALGVKTIIDFRVNPLMVLHERLLADSLGIRYINLPTGNFWPNPQAQETFMNTVTAASKDPACSPVFVHCAHGTDRTGFFIAQWRVKHDGWTWTRALAEMMKYGFVLHKLQH